jgi:Uma2 family endonuclease
LSYADYALIPDDGRRHEVLDGEHVMSPAPRTRHQRLVGDLFYALRRHVRRNGLGEVFVAPFDVLLSAHDIVQPDLLFVADHRLGIVDEDNCKGAPDLVVEVLSPATRRRDLVDKRLLYDRAGVAEYWAVDPEAETVQVFRQGADGLTRVAERAAAHGAALTTDLLPGLALPLSDLFAGRAA